MPYDTDEGAGDVDVVVARHEAGREDGSAVGNVAGGDGPEPSAGLAAEPTAGRDGAEPTAETAAEQVAEPAGSPAAGTPGDEPGVSGAGALEGGPAPKKKAKSGKGKKSKAGGGKKKAAGAAAATGRVDEVATLPAPALSPTTDEVPVPPGAGAGGRGSGFAPWVAAHVLVLAIGVVAVVAIVALVLSRVQVGNLQADSRSAAGVDGARTSALSAARTYAADIASYDYRRLNQDFGVVLAHSTPSFRKSFGKSSAELKSTLVKFHATAKATVVAAGVVSVSADHAVVLVFLEQTVTNSAQKSPTTDRSQVEITLVRSGDNWLIDQVTLL